MIGEVMQHRSEFVDRHIGPNQYQIQTMLLELGYKDLDSFIKAVVPQNIHIKGDIEKALSKAVAGGFNGTHQLSQVVRRTIGSWVGEEHRRKPMIIPLVVEV
ncbi:MAG: hypothetical protein RJB29_717 [Actinomycetota bacterium]